MTENNQQFGLVIAYLLPGFIGLGGLVPVMPAVAQWLVPINWGEATGLAGPIYTLLSALTVGMIISAVRWVVIDHIHQWTGIAPASPNFQQLGSRLDALDYLVLGHYRFYQFYANGLIAVIWAYGVNRAFQTSPLLGPGTDLGVFVLCAVLFAGSRDTLRKFRQRVSQLAG